MTKLLTTALLLCASLASAYGPDTYTTRLNLVQPSTGSPNWGVKLNDDLAVIDSSAALQAKTNTFTSSNTFKAPVLMSGTSIQLTGSGGYVKSDSSGTFSALFGDGSHLTGVSNTDYGPSTAALRVDLTSEIARATARENAIASSTATLASVKASTGTCTLPNFPITLNSGNVVCAQPSNTTGQSNTTLALASAGTASPSGFVSRGVDASGNSLNATVDASAISGSTNPIRSDAVFTGLAGKLGATATASGDLAGNYPSPTLNPVQNNITTLGHSLTMTSPSTPTFLGGTVGLAAGTTFYSTDGNVYVSSLGATTPELAISSGGIAIPTGSTVTLSYAAFPDSANQCKTPRIHGATINSGWDFSSTSGYLCGNGQIVAIQSAGNKLLLGSGATGNLDFPTTVGSFTVPFITQVGDTRSGLTSAGSAASQQGTWGFISSGTAVQVWQSTGNGAGANTTVIGTMTVTSLSAATYSLGTSTGINIHAGELAFDSGSSGLKFGDGTRQNTASGSETNTYTSSKTFTNSVLGKSSVTASAFFGDGSHLTGISGSFSGGIVTNYTKFQSSVTFIAPGTSLFVTNASSLDNGSILTDGSGGLDARSLTTASGSYGFGAGGFAEFSQLSSDGGLFTSDGSGNITAQTYTTQIIGCSLGLTTNGSGVINGCVASDKRLKRDIHPLRVSLDLFDQLRPVTYRWRATTKRDHQEHIGFIAQDVEAVYPDAVVSAGAGDLKGVDPNALIAILVKEVQNLRRRVGRLEGR